MILTIKCSKCNCHYNIINNNPVGVKNLCLICYYQYYFNNDKIRMTITYI